MKEKEKSISGGQLFTSLIYLALGVCLAVFPGEAVNIICKIVFGIVLMLTGLYHIWMYLSEEGGTSIFNLFTGAILLVLGVFFFQNPQIVKMILPSLLAALLLVDSIWTLRAGLRLKKYDRGEWKFFVVVSLLFVTLGIILFINPFTEMKYTIIFAGCSFIGDALIDFVSMVLVFWGNRAIHKSEIQTLPIEQDKKEKKRSLLPVLGKLKKSNHNLDAVSADAAPVEREEKKTDNPENGVKAEAAEVSEVTEDSVKSSRKLGGLLKNPFGRKKDKDSVEEPKEAFEAKEEPDRVQEMFELKEEPDRVQEVFELKEEPDRVQEMFELKEEPNRVQEVFELKEEPDRVQEVFEPKEEKDVLKDLFEEANKEAGKLQEMFTCQEEKDHLQNLLKLDEDALEEWKD